MTNQRIAGTLSTLRALESAIGRLGDELPAADAGHITARFNALAWSLRSSQRHELAELLADLAGVLHDAHSPS